MPDVIGESIPLVSFVLKIVTILPGATLTEDSEATSTTRRFWAGRALEIAHWNVASSKSFIVSPLRSRPALTVGGLLAIVGPLLKYTQCESTSTFHGPGVVQILHVLEFKILGGWLVARAIEGNSVRNRTLQR